MALPERQVIIGTRTQGAFPFQTFVFVPRLSSGSGELLLKKKYVAVTDADGNGSILLPCKTAGAIRWTCYTPTDYDGDGDFEFDLVLGDGSPIGLDELHTAGATEPPGSPVYEYVGGLLAARQPLDADLTAIAAIDSAQSGVIASIGAGWIFRTWAQVKTALGLTKADVGLSNADNTSDASKPVSTAQAAADAAARDAAISTIRNGVAAAGNDLAKLYALIQAINAVVGGATPDGDSVTNTVAEVLTVMATYPEGVNVLTTLNGKVNTADVLNALTQTAAGKVLDARQGKILNDAINTLTDEVGQKIEKASGAGGTNYVAKFDESGKLTDSSFSEDNGLIEFGTGASKGKFQSSSGRSYLGDTESAGNGTLIYIDDTGEQVNITALSGLIVNGQNIETVLADYESRLAALESE